MLRPPTPHASSAGDALASLGGGARGQVRAYRGTAVLRCVALFALAVCSAVVAAQTVPYDVTNDGISAPLTTQPSDANRGREIASSRQIGMCILCHTIPKSSDKFQGDIATQLAGAGARWSVPQLRLRVVDSRRLNADSVMPAYHKTEGLSRVGTAWRNKPILDAQQVEDVVAWLATLK